MRSRLEISQRSHCTRSTRDLDFLRYLNPNKPLDSKDFNEKEALSLVKYEKKISKKKKF